jgi:purine-binding chemotaxis protein CheW
MAEQISQYITFKLGNELFAINVERVREVLEVSAITRVPTAPDYMLGVVNVRGKAIPVVDLRKRFGLPSIQDTLSTRIIVMELMLDGEATVLGGMADSVHEVIELDASEINPPPRIAMRWRTEFIKGMGRRGEDFLIILDVNAVFAAEEVNLMQTESAAEQLEPSAA